MGRAIDDLCAGTLSGLLAGLLVGVSGRGFRRVAYGSAVAGRVSSGRRGRRSGADIKEPADKLAAVKVDVCPLEEAVIAAAAAAAPDVAARRLEVEAEKVDPSRDPCPLRRVDVGRPADVDVEETCLTGEKVACADVGRSGRRLLAI